MAAQLRRELQTDVDMVRGQYGEFKVLVDGDTVIDGGAAAFLGRASLTKADLSSDSDPPVFVIRRLSGSYVLISVSIQGSRSKCTCGTVSHS